MSRRIVVEELFEDVEVDLFGHPFVLLEVTRSVEANLDRLVEDLNKLQADAEGAPEDTDLAETMVSMYGDMLDVILRPVPPDGQKRGGTKAKTVLLSKYKADEIGLQRVISLVEHIQEASADRGRPTSQPQTSG